MKPAKAVFETLLEEMGFELYVAKGRAFRIRTIEDDPTAIPETDVAESVVYKIRDGLGTTRAHQSSTSPEQALADYSASVGVPSEQLRNAGWNAVR